MFKAKPIFKAKDDSIHGIHVFQNFCGLSGSSKDIELISLSDMKSIGKLKGHNNFVKNLCFSADGRNLLSCSDDGFVKLWDLSSMKQVASLQVSKEELYGLDYSSNFYGVSSETEIILGDFRKNLSVVKKIQDVHTDSISQIKFYGNILLSGSDDGCINKYNLGAKEDDDLLEEVLNTEDAVKKFGFFEKTKFVYTLSYTHTLSIWDWTTNKKLISVDRENFKSDVFIDVHFSSSNAFLFTGQFSGEFDLYKLNDSLKGEKISNFKGHQGPVSSVWTNEKVILSGGEDGYLLLWETIKN